MAEEENASSEIVTNKRKYYDEDQTTPSTIPRKPTAPAPAVGTYNSVPPPMDDFQLAKQKAQEIAARLLNTAADPKKPRLDDTSGFDSFQHKPTITPPVKSSYGYPEPSKKIEVPSARVGVIIGKGGETIKYLQIQSGAKIQVTRDVDADPYSPTRAVELMGTPEQIAKAEQLINDVLAEADTGGSGVVSRRITGQVSGAEQFVMKVPNNKVGLVIGKGGETIKNMQARTGARIQVIPLRLPPGDTSTERTVQIDGSSEQIEAAKQLVYEVTSEVFVVVLSLTAHIVGAYQLCEEMSFSSISFLFVKNRVRNPGMTGGYHQQGYQARPPASWAPPSAQMQQPGYGYLQPGAYPGPPLQYNMSQPPYPGYPSQPASGGYASGWDQSTAPNQQTSQAGGAGGYDYYSQQATPQQQQTPGGSAASTDNSVNSYNQQLASGYNQGQGYSQDGYGGYNAPIPQSGYQGPGYDQQQSYSSTAGYGNVSNPTSDGHITSYATQGDGSQAPAPVQSSAMGQQGYQSGQQPSPNPSYPSQGSTQAGYGMPPTSQGGYGTQPAAGYGAGYAHPQAQKPPTSQPAYGQPQQSPSAHGGYAQPPPVQPGYPQPPAAHSGYGPGDSGVHRPPSSGYGIPTAHPGYGAPPMAQPSYGQQPPSYSSTYAGGYSSDGSGGSARGTYDANPASQSAQPTSVTGAPKASPQS